MQVPLHVVPLWTQPETSALLDLLGEVNFGDAGGMGRTCVV